MNSKDNIKYFKMHLGENLVVLWLIEMIQVGEVSYFRSFLQCFDVDG